MIFYLFKVAIILAGCLVFYKLLLQKETFFPLNRWILLICLVLSFGLPLIPIPEQFSFRKIDSVLINPVHEEVGSPIGQVIEPVKNASSSIENKEIQDVINWEKGLKYGIWLYWLGVIIFGINFLVQLISLIYRAKTAPIIKDGKYNIIEVSGNKAPCSFGNNIYINPEKYDWETYSQILLHEKIHVQQGHSYDIILAELAIVFQWFNPFAWMYRKAIEDNLEFLTDNELIEKQNIEKKSYQMSLVKVSSPHFPLSLTTNYNQSILKRRVLMMQSKKSNIHTTWKYLFIVPFLVFTMCFLNEPLAYSKKTNYEISKTNFQNIHKEGYWFATIKDNTINIRFSTEEGDKNGNNTTFQLREFTDLPLEKSGNFKLSREAGTMRFNGRFENNIGMGKYIFTPNESFISFFKSEGIDISESGNDCLVYFFINVKKTYVAMLKRQGFKSLNKEDIIPMVALQINETYIQSIKENGFPNVKIQELIPLKSLNVDGNYIREIKESGYNNLTVSNIVSLKAQNIDGKFLKDSKDSMEATKINKALNKKINTDTPTEVHADISTATETKGSKGNKGSKSDIGDLIEQIIANKVLNVTPEFGKQISDMGYKVNNEELIALRALNITPEFIKGIENSGYKNLKIDDIIALKSLNISPSTLNGFKEIGIKINIDDIIGAISLGITPDYIKSMVKKGYKYDDLNKYIDKKTPNN